MYSDFAGGPYGVGQALSITSGDVGKWIRLEGSATVDPAKVCNVIIWIVGANADVLVDAAQVEAKPYATSFVVGTRASEKPTIPTAGEFTPGSWTKEFFFVPTSLQAVTDKTGYLWECYIDADNYYALKVDEDSKPYLEVASEGTVYRTATASAPVLAVGTPYALAVRGDGSLIALFVNGTEISEVSYVEPVGTLPANQYLGCDHSGANHANGSYCDYRASSRARTDEEILQGYESGLPLPWDEDTTLKLDFDGPDAQRASRVVVVG